MENKIKITYRQVGDFKIPNIRLPEEENVTLGRYGMMRMKFLQKNKSGMYMILITKGILMRTLKKTEDEATEMLERLTEQMMKAQGVTEELKESNQMLWVQMMNNIRHSAEEIVLKELIYT